MKTLKDCCIKELIGADQCGMAEVGCSKCGSEYKKPSLSKEWEKEKEKK